MGSLFDIIEIVERPQLSQPLVCNIRQSYLYLCQAKHPSVSHARSLQAVKTFNAADPAILCGSVGPGVAE